jgi:23S rRNA (guanosine2251-2'-O)-methyltransferase
MGAIQHLNLIKVSNLSQALEKLKKANYWIYTSCLDSGATDYRKIKYDKKSVLVVGNEENGVSPLIISNSDFLVKIPMLGKIQSLNVSVATGILLSRIEH